VSSHQSSAAFDFVVDRGDLRRSKIVRTGPPPSIAVGEALLRVDAFAFTANNITYGVVGEMMSYWNFFPAEPGWGRIPVWGFADVVESRHDALTTGERVFGYLPMSTHLVVQPDRVSRTGFVDAMPHRAGLPPVYNQYTRVSGDPSYAADAENELMLFRPLFITAFLIDDFLADNDFFGASTVVLASASSKTAFGVAFLLSGDRASRCRVIGLTSPGNREFVRGLGCYDRVVDYGSIGSLPRDPAVFVDMAGDGRVMSAIHHHFGDGLKHSSIVGVTHWEQRAQPGEPLPGPTPTFFFAPTQIEKRHRDWGPEGFQQRYGAAWQRFVQFTRRHVEVVHGRGPDAIERVYREMLEGRAKPSKGHILSPRE
jgi:hypothetical protein